MCRENIKPVQVGLKSSEYLLVWNVSLQQEGRVPSSKAGFFNPHMQMKRPPVLPPNWKEHIDDFTGGVNDNCLPTTWCWSDGLWSSAILSSILSPKSGLLVPNTQSLLIPHAEGASLCVYGDTRPLLHGHDQWGWLRPILYQYISFSSYGWMGWVVKRSLGKYSLVSFFVKACNNEVM